MTIIEMFSKELLEKGVSEGEVEKIVNAYIADRAERENLKKFTPDRYTEVLLNIIRSSFQLNAKKWIQQNVPNHPAIAKF